MKWQPRSALTAVALGALLLPACCEVVGDGDVDIAIEPTSKTPKPKTPAGKARPAADRTPDKPGMMGLFADYPIGSTLLEARGVGTVYTKSASGLTAGTYIDVAGQEVWTGGYTVLPEHLTAKGAFPWTWENPKDINVPTSLIFIGPNKKVAFGNNTKFKMNSHHKPDQTRVIGVSMSFFDAKNHHDAALGAMTKMWGEPLVYSYKDLERPFDVRLWREADECVVLSSGYVNDDPNFELKIGRCWTPERWLEHLLGKPGEKSRVVGVETKALTAGGDGFALAKLKRDDDGSTYYELKHPSIFFRPELVFSPKVTLDKDRVESVKYETFISGLDTAIATKDGAPLMMGDALRESLGKWGVPKDAIEASSTKRQSHTLANGLHIAFKLQTDQYALEVSTKPLE